MTRVPARPRRQGVAAVELAFVLPLILLPVMFGVWEVGRLIQVQQIVNNSVREGARAASTGQYTNSQVQQVVLKYLTNAGVSTTSVTATVSNQTRGGDVSSPTLGQGGTAQQLDSLQVTVSVPFSNVYWIALNYFVPAGTTLNATANTVSMVNVPLTIPQTIPGSPL
jgi:Flp pilus assembly protein TadG